LPALARCFPRSFTFYVADPISSIETRSLPTSLAATHRGFAFYLAFPVRSLRRRHACLYPPLRELRRGKQLFSSCIVSGLRCIRDDRHCKVSAEKIDFRDD